MSLTLWILVWWNCFLLDLWRLQWQGTQFEKLQLIWKSLKCSCSILQDRLLEAESFLANVILGPRSNNFCVRKTWVMWGLWKPLLQNMFHFNYLHLSCTRHCPRNIVANQMLWSRNFYFNGRETSRRTLLYHTVLQCVVLYRLRFVISGSGYWCDAKENTVKGVMLLFI